MRKQRHVALIGTAVAVALFATGCGSEGGEASGQKIEPAGQAADDGYGGSKGETGEASGKRDAPAQTLKVKADSKLGDMVTDSKGWTLYRFDDDTASPSQSNCAGACEKAWPPVPAKDAEASKGISEAEIGKVKRTDGSWQLTLGGWPVYRYAKDAKPGDTKGHGVKKMWNALAPDGNKADPASIKKLKAVDNPELGKILSDAKGRTLYRFDKDSAWPMKSNCKGSCLDTWKPAQPVDKSKIEGVDPKLLTTYKRADGTEQLTIDCWPLYWFTGDKEPGDINGQGKGGVWHAATDKGKKAGVAP
ncbi:SCO0930 family lipoprotein [Streptomyces albidus (ex Kaewkla and Franco 2022)]|uniref:SCO0930 family lipoprotein n=1 Tax=Streptomyces albidus (ex Kaewkla and Franco 2022) TaxID=722709 RepID=UPI0015EF21A8|nr:SCO0930 family lipoprotein [Streptomyces albidus (ex Kaewkla and Franco 2022)]